MPAGLVGLVEVDADLGAGHRVVGDGAVAVADRDCRIGRVGNRVAGDHRVAGVQVDPVVVVAVGRVEARVGDGVVGDQVVVPLSSIPDKPVLLIELFSITQWLPLE